MQSSPQTHNQAQTKYQTQTQTTMPTNPVMPTLPTKGSRISLILKNDIRYEGILCAFDNKDIFIRESGQKDGKSCKRTSCKGTDTYLTPRSDTDLTPIRHYLTPI